jgi:hypothetical protein
VSISHGSDSPVSVVVIDPYHEMELAKFIAYVIQLSDALKIILY